MHSHDERESPFIVLCLLVYFRSFGTVYFRLAAFK